MRVSPQPTDGPQADRTVDLKVEVEDTGVGVSSDKRESIFAKFTQIRPGDNCRRGGTGLGLSISKAIIDEMGGEIGVESNEGIGSTFWFRIDLPIERWGRLRF